MISLTPPEGIVHDADKVNGLRLTSMNEFSILAAFQATSTPTEGLCIPNCATDMLLLESMYIV